VYTPSAAEVTAGTVTLTLTTNDPAGSCPSVNDAMTITINPVATANAGPDQTICAGSTVTLAGSVGGSATSGSWSGGTGTFTPNNTTLNAVYTPSAAERTAGTVTLTLTTNDPAGPCVAAVDNVTITIEPAATVNAGIDQTICAGGTATLAGAIGGSATSATWSGGTGTFAPNNTTLNAVYTPSAAEVTAGTVTLTLTTNDPAGSCPSVNDAMIITINPNPTATITGTLQFCQGGSTLLTSSVGDSYQWIRNGSDIVGATNQTFTATVVGDYQVRVTTLSCSATSSIAAVTEVTPPSTSLTVDKTISPVCIGGSSAITVLLSESGVSYQLRQGTTAIGSSQNGNGGTLTFSTGALSTVGSIVFNVLASRGGCTPVQLTETETVVVSGTINAGLALSPQQTPVCEGSSTNIIIQNSENGVLYQLRNDADDSPIGAQVPGNGSSISLPTAVLNANTTFNILATNGACSIEMTTTPLVSVSVNPDPSLVVTGPASSVCTGGTASITIQNSEVGVTYQLRDDSNDLPSGASVAGTGATITLISAPLAASASFNILASSVACAPVELTTIVSVTVTGTIDASLSVTAANSTICTGSSTTIEVGSPEAGVNYTLRNDADNSIVAGPLTGISVIFNTGSLTANTTFNVLAENGTCSVELTNTVTVQVEDNPLATLDLSASINPVCSGNTSAVLVSNSESGVSYQLRLEPSDVLVGTPVVGTGGTISLPTGVLTADTDFNVLATRGSCSPVELLEIVTITIGAGTINVGSATTASPGTICQGTGTFVQVQNSEVGVSYQLRNDADNSLVGTPIAGNGGTINLPTGNLTVTTDFNVLALIGTCSAQLSDEETINVNPVPDVSRTVTSSNGSNPICSGTSVTIIVASENGVDYQLRNNADNSLIGGVVTGNGGNINLPSGVLTSTTTFNVQATLGSCSVQLTQLITITLRPVGDPACSGPCLLLPGIAKTDATCNGIANGSITINSVNIIGPGAGAPFSYSIDNGATFQPSNSFTNLAGGVNYAVLVEDAGGCRSSVSTIFVANAATLLATINKTNVTNCVTDDGSITITNPTGSTDPVPTYSFSIDNGSNFQASGSFTPLGQGAYPVVIQDNLGCRSQPVLISISRPVNCGSVVNCTGFTATAGDFSNAVCAGTATGGARITVTDPNAPTSPVYQYSIIGDFSDAKAFVSGGSPVNDLPPNGTYNILLRRLGNNGDPECQTLVQVTILDSFIQPVTLNEPAAKQDATCANNDGTITAILTGGVGPYTYKFGKVGEEIDITAYPADNVFRGLSSGDYSLIITDASTCGPYTIDLPQIVFPGIVDVYDIDRLDPTCTGGGDDGKISFTIDNFIPNNFQVAVLTDPAVVPTNPQFVDVVSNPVEILNLASGSYFVWLRTISSACPTRLDSDSTILKGAVPITYSLDSVNEKCFGQGGFIRFKNLRGVSGFDYEYLLSKDGAPIPGGNITAIEALGSPLSGTVTPGNYEVIITQPGTTDGCVTPPQQITVFGPPSLLQIAEPVVPSPAQETSFIDDPTAARSFVVTGGEPTHFMWLLDAFNQLVRDTTEVLSSGAIYKKDFVGLGPGAYTVAVIDDFGCVSSREFEIGEKTEIFIPNIFTPNNDAENKNEVFFIRNLPATGSKLVISNRWGNEVYSSKDYQNDWNAEGVSDGIYFYRLMAGGQEFSGWVEILRGNKP
jgi:hypothetical protein